MRIQTAEATENPSVLPFISTEITESLEQSTLPVVDHLHTAETLEPSSPLVSNMHQVTNTHETAPSDVPTPPPVTNKQTSETMEKSVMASGVTDNSHDNLIASHGKYQGWEMRQETAEEEEEVRSVLKVIAATGKFWYDWGKLRSMLSLHLMQVISEYPQAKMTTDEQKRSLGETHAELAKRLDNALHRFIDGPPFTLQRLSEILLDARVLYPNLSKLASALEKNLSVTSTLTISTDPYPPALITEPNGLNKVTEVPNPSPRSRSQLQSVAVAADRDEIMTDAEADVSDFTTMDVDTTETSLDSNSMTPAFEIVLLELRCETVVGYSMREVSLFAAPSSNGPGVEV